MSLKEVSLDEALGEDSGRMIAEQLGVPYEKAAHRMEVATPEPDAEAAPEEDSIQVTVNEDGTHTLLTPGGAKVNMGQPPHAIQLVAARILSQTGAAQDPMTYVTVRSMFHVRKRWDKNTEKWVDCKTPTSLVDMQKMMNDLGNEACDAVVAVYTHKWGNSKVVDLPLSVR